MPTTVATHDGPFHADDVLAVSLIRTFYDPDAQVVRTRDASRIDEADLVVDVGAVHDPDRGRFDHHQASYQGPMSAAGMVLTWLTDTAKVPAELSAALRSGVMDYIDAVDNGRVAPDPAVPCFPRIVEALTHNATDHASFDVAFEEAVQLGVSWLRGLQANHDAVARARRVVKAAMQRAADAGTRLIELEEYVPWKPVYFEQGGETHPTDYVLHPGTDGSWRVVAIPPKLGDFGQKRPLPEAWAGLTDGDLETVTGVPGSVFCHKNRFIAVFRTRQAALAALRSHQLL